MLSEEEFNNSPVKFNYEDYNDYVNQMSQDIGEGITSTLLPKFDMANLPMYEKDDSEQEYTSGTEPSGIAKLLQYVPFIGDKSLSVNLLRNLVPKQDPRAINMRNFYGSQYGLTPTGSLASGIMAGYNPISGGLFGTPVNYGLADAARRRIEKIANRKAAQTDASRARIKELQEFARADTLSRARQAAPDVYEKASSLNLTDSSGGFKSAGTDSVFSNKTGRGRTGF